MSEKNRCYAWRMAERLICYQDCPFVQNGIVRPCSEMVYKDQSGDCAQRIAKDQAFAGVQIKVEATIDNLMSRSVRVRSGNKNEAVVIGGFIYRQNISEY